MNLAASDAFMIEMFFLDVPSVWGIPLQLCFTIGLLLAIIGLPALSGLAALLIVYPFLSFANSIIHSTVSEKIEMSDQRLKLTNELIQV